MKQRYSKRPVKKAEVKPQFFKRPGRAISLLDGTIVPYDELIVMDDETVEENSPFLFEYVNIDGHLLAKPILPAEMQNDTATWLYSSTELFDFNIQQVKDVLKTDQICSVAQYVEKVHYDWKCKKFYALGRVQFEPDQKPFFFESAVLGYLNTELPSSGRVLLKGKNGKKTDVTSSYIAFHSLPQYNFHRNQQTNVSHFTTPIPFNHYRAFARNGFELQTRQIENLLIRTLFRQFHMSFETESLMQKQSRRQRIR